MNPAGAFVVDPDTQHLYAAYGRGNIPQLERQKLMTGTHITYVRNSSIDIIENNGKASHVQIAREREQERLPQTRNILRKPGRQIDYSGEHRLRARTCVPCQTYVK